MNLLAKASGIEQNLYPHKLRHTVATHLLESSGNIRAVQEFLGHENISTTQIYTHLDNQYLMTVYDKVHPRSKKQIKRNKNGCECTSRDKPASAIIIFNFEV